MVWRRIGIASGGCLRLVVGRFREMKADHPERAQSLAFIGIDGCRVRRAAESLSRMSILKPV